MINTNKCVELAFILNKMKLKNKTVVKYKRSSNGLKYFLKVKQIKKKNQTIKNKKDNTAINILILFNFLRKYFKDLVEILKISRNQRKCCK